MTIHLLMLTGCRRNEILTLRWEHVDLDAAEIRLNDGKTGVRKVHLSQSAVSFLVALSRKSGNPWVIPGARPGMDMTDIDGAWKSIRARALGSRVQGASSRARVPLMDYGGIVISSKKYFANIFRCLALQNRLF